MQAQLQLVKDDDATLDRLSDQLELVEKLLHTDKLTSHEYDCSIRVTASTCQSLGVNTGVAELKDANDRHFAANELLCCLKDDDNRTEWYFTTDNSIYEKMVEKLKSNRAYLKFAILLKAGFDRTLQAALRMDSSDSVQTHEIRG